MDFAQRFKVLLWALCLFVVAAFVPQANAANWTLTSGNSTVAFNDSGSAGKSPGVYSWIFDSVEHVSQQAFYYRIGTTSPELPVSGDALDSTAPFTVAATGQTASSVTLTFTEKAGRFTMAVTYELIGGTTGRSTLNKKVVITNLTAAPLDLHLFSYSDYDLKTGPDLFENTAIVNGKAYQSNFATASDTVGSGTTLVERATVPPSRYGIDNSQFLGNLANGATPYDLDNFAGPYTIPGGIFDNGDKQFALQWDLTVDPATPTSFTITDAFYPTKALYLSKSTPGTCVNYGQTFTNTYTFDNTRNTSSPVNNIQISEQLARDISLASATNGGTYDATTGTVNWNVPQLAAGAVQQTVQGTFTVNSAVDFTMASQLASDEAFPSSYSAKLTLCNHPPAITSSPVKSGTEGQPYSYQVTASDSDAGTTLTYSLDAAPTSMQIDPTTGLITWTPTSAQTGNNTVTVRVSDGSLSATQTYTLFIAYINAPPAFTSTPATTATVGQVYTYMAVAADPNKGDKVTYGLPTAPAGMTIDPNLGVITWTPDATQVGVNHVVVQATDSGYLYVTQAFDITVSSGVTNSPPTITSAPVASATDNVAYSYTVVATDPNNDSLTYSLAGAPAGMTISGNVISWPSPVAGSYSLTVTVNDGKGGTVSQNWLLTVTHVNRPPVINTTALPAGTDAASYSSQVDATDPDKDALSYSLLYQPVGLTISSTGLLSWASPVAGTYTFNVTVTDSNQASTTKSFTFTITKVTKTTPTITWATPAAITYGTALSSAQLNASVSGGIAGSFTYSPAAGTVLNSGSQTLNVTFTPNDTATYNSATASVTLTVNKAAATVTLGGLSATYDGTAKSATATTTPAGKSVTFTYNGSAAAPTAAGSYTVVGTVSDPNYTGSATGTMTIAKATPTITWAAPAPVYIGTALSSTQLNATASVAGSFTYTPAAGTVMNTAGSQTLSASFTPTDSANYTSATKSVTLTVNNKTTPTITWATPAAITYGTALSSAQLNASVSGGIAGSFTYTPAAGAVLNSGSQTLNVTFTPTDTATYNSATASVTLTVNKAAATVTLGGLSATYDGTAKSATATTTPAGKSVTFTYNGSATAPTAAGSYTVVGTVSDPNYTGSATGTLVIAKATPTITWATPAAVYVGTALSSTQLNATASVPGTFTYTPAAGTVMNTAGTQTLSVSFTPTDTANYNGATKSVTLTVNNKQTPTITWATPAAITYGTTLSSTQLNASVSGGIAGSFTYSPAAGTVLNAGTQTLSVTFTPNDTATYNSATASVTLTVNKAAATVTVGGLSATYDGTAKSATATTTPAGKSVTFTYNGSATAPTAAGSYTVVGTVSDPNYTGSATGTMTIAKATPTITWATPAAVYVGTALSSTQLNATASVPGTFTYTPAAGTVMNTSGTQTLSASFTPTDSANYTSATKSVTLTVNNKTTSTITWATPAAITYGTALSGTQLNASVSGGIAGSFTYSPAAGTVLNSGSQTLNVTFTPTDTATYNSATASVTLAVNKASATVTLGGLSATYDGTAKSATATTTPAGKSVTFTYNGSATAPTAAGSYTVVGTVSDPNYTGSATGTLVIAKATPVITWNNPAAVYVGTTLSSTQLNATASVPGTFTYTPAAGTVMNTSGTQTLSASFTPTDSANYTSATKSVTLTVNNKTTPTITWATPAAITYGTALSSAQLNANVSGGIVGSFTYSPAAGTVLNSGSQTLNVTFTPTDTTTYNSATASVTLTVNKASATVTLGGLSATYDGTAKSATATTTPAGKSVTFTYNGSAAAPTAAGSYTVVGTVTDPNYTGSATGTLVIAKATPVITWATPSAVAVGTALSSTQLNAGASVPGTFIYTPAAGTVLDTAGSVTLKADFTPTDTTNYTTATKSVSITVNTKQAPVITWATPTAITYGTALSATQLNAQASVPGTFTYSPAAGAILDAGSQTLTATFTPDDTTNYTTTTASVTLTVDKAAATVTLGGLSATYDGTAKSATATTTPAGKSVTFTYNGSATVPSAAGSYTVVGTVADPNYTGSATGTLVIARATPTIAWATPSAVAVGTALSSTQLNATASVPGTFVYTPAAGTVLDTAGTVTLKADFTPTDSANYTTATATVSLTVTAAPNQAPTMTAIPAATITAPAAFSYQVTAADPENQTLSYTFAGNPAGMTISSTGLISWPTSVAGTYTVTVKATDPGGLSASQSFTLTVNSAATTNQAPVISSLPVTNGYEEGYYYYQVQASDPDGDSLRYSLTARPSGMTIDAATGLIYWRPESTGTYTVTVKVTDPAGLSATQNYKLTIAKRPWNSSPRITSTPVTVATVDIPYAYDVQATDYNGDTLYYRLTSAPSGMTIDLATGLISWTPTASQVGDRSVSVEVADSKGGRATQSFTVRVTSSAPAANNPPTFTSTPVTTATAGSAYAYDANATDPDGDTLTYTLAAAPSGMVISSGTGIIGWIPTSSQTGSSTVTVEVSDGRGGTATQSFTVTVGESATNSPPTFTSTPITTAVKRQTYRYEVSAVDPNGDDISYSLTSKPEGMSIGSSTGVITWYPRSTGNYKVTVRARDSKGSSAYQTFTIKVVESISADKLSVGDGTGTSPTLNCDVNGDGGVTYADLLLILAGRGKNEPRLDINGDGIVTLLDARACVGQLR